MFKKLQIKNFKSHKDTEIDFHPNVNVLVGDPQSGKTNIIRGLLLLAKNRPSGGAFLSTFAGKKGCTEISLSCSDAPTIVLKKDIKIDDEGEKRIEKAEYILGDKSYKGFGKDVPDTIRDVLNLTDINIQKQFDIPFLITSSPGEIARTINRVTKLEPVDGWVGQLTSNINKTNVEIRIIEDQKKEIKSELERYSDIDEVEIIIDELFKTHVEERDLQRQEFVLDKYLVDMERIKEQLRKLTSLLSTEKYVLKAESLGKQIDKLLEEQELLEEVLYLATDISTLTGFLEVEKEVLVAEGLTQEIESSLLQENLLQEIIALDSDAVDLEEEKEKLTKDYVEKLKEFGRCPTCFSVIDANRMKAITKEI